MAVKKFQTYGALETYHELGSYKFKIVLNPRFFKVGQGFSVDFIDSENKRSIYHKCDIWGRKLNVQFLISDVVPDGVASCKITRHGVPVGEVKFWVIKP